MSDNEERKRRSINRVSADKTVIDISNEESRKEISVLDEPRDIESIQRKLGIAVEQPVVRERFAVVDDIIVRDIENKMTKDDREVISLYMGVPTRDVRGSKIIDRDYQLQLYNEMNEYPFWLYINNEDQYTIEKLYLEYYVVTLQLQAYNRLSDAVPEEEEEVVIEMINRRATFISHQEDLTIQIGEIVSRNLTDLDDNEDIIFVPDGFTDETDLSAAIHQKIVVNSNHYAWSKYRRDL